MISFGVNFVCQRALLGILYGWLKELLYSGIQFIVENCHSLVGTRHPTNIFALFSMRQWSLLRKIHRCLQFSSTLVSKEIQYFAEVSRCAQMNVQEFKIAGSMNLLNCMKSMKFMKDSESR